MVPTESTPADGEGPACANSRMAVAITEATEATTDLLAALHRLVPQLSSSATSLSLSDLQELLRSGASTLLVAHNASGQLVGSLTLAVFRVPTGVRAWIEDVVVDDDARGAGIGAALVGAALDRATAAGARSVDLTSRPSRQAANRLYRRLGFEPRQTNVYRWSAPA